MLNELTFISNRQQIIESAHSLVKFLGWLVNSRAKQITVAVCLGCWVALFQISPQASFGALCIGNAVSNSTSLFQNAALPYIHAGLMAVAMMVPFALSHYRHIRDSVEPALAGVAIFSFAVTYGAIWVAVSCLLELINQEVLASLPRIPLLLLSVVFAAAWQMTETKAAALARCHDKAALAPGGLTALRTSAAFGVRHSGNCMKACLPMMAISTVSGHAFGLMILLAFLMGLERFSARPKLLIITCTLLALFAALLASALLGYF
jgi:hypothetical protein